MANYMTDASTEINPNHMIIWLDDGIGDPTKYHHLKRAFTTTADPKNETPHSLTDDEYTNLICSGNIAPVQFEGVWFLLAAFRTVEECIQCFELNQEKRIFFITSGSLGEIAVPKIMKKFPNIFDDPITGESYSSIYIFCHNIEFQIEWAMEYCSYIQIFNFDADVLVRMIRDIANYFLNNAKHILSSSQPNYLETFHILTWARELYERYGTIEKCSMTKEISDIDSLMQTVEDALKPSSDDEN